MDYALRSLKNNNVFFVCSLNVSNFSSGRRSPGGRVKSVPHLKTCDREAHVVKTVMSPWYQQRSHVVGVRPE